MDRYPTVSHSPQGRIGGRTGEGDLAPRPGRIGGHTNIKSIRPPIWSPLIWPWGILQDLLGTSWDPNTRHP